MSVDHDSIKANDLLVEGKGLYDAGKYEEAIASFDKALEIKPKFADVWNSKGDALRGLKKYEEAVTSYDKAIEADPKNAGAWVNKGIVLRIDLSRHNDAIASFDKAIEIDPKNAGAWNHKGNVLSTLSREDDAFACYDKATEIDPKDAVFWSNKGIALRILKKYEESIASFDKATEIDSEYAYTWRNKAVTLRKLERYDDAMMCYDKAIKIDPKDATAWKGMRITLKKLGCPEYDTRCASCDHYPWTDVFTNTQYSESDTQRYYQKSHTPNWQKLTDYYGKERQFSSAHNQYKCECGCHNVPTNKKLMRFSFKLEKGESQHVMHVEKLAVCPFCKRSEFEDSAYAHMPRDELLAEDLKATGAPKREYEFDYNKKYLDRKDRYVELTPCAGNHKHEWNLCKCGRWVCKISFRNYFGYEIDDDLFNNDLVDKSHYSKRIRALLDRDEYEDEYEPKPDEVPVYATMETIEKVWGKMPRYRHNPGHGGWGPSSYFTYQYEDETTRPKPLRVFDMSDAIVSMEEMHNRFLEAKKLHEKQLEWRFVNEVYGIGEITTDKFLKKFRNADKVFSATVEKIAEVLGISESRARNIRKKLDEHPKEYGQEYRDKERKKPFTYQPSWGGYKYTSKSFEETS